MKIRGKKSSELRKYYTYICEELYVLLMSYNSTETNCSINEEKNGLW